MRTVHILSGVPGCGKSYFAQSLQFKGAVVCSADKFFVQLTTGEYRFDITKLGQAHAYCMSSFLDEIDKDVDIIIDNTNLERWEWINYSRIASSSGRSVQHHCWMVDNIRDLAFCASRNTHGVSVEDVVKMALRHSVPAGATIHAIEGVRL